MRWGGIDERSSTDRPEEGSIDPQVHRSPGEHQPDRLHVQLWALNLQVR